MVKTHEKILVMGLGNILCGDDGFGPLVINHLENSCQFPKRLCLVDGGVQGQSLYGFIEEADRLIIIDAIDFGLLPGTLVQKESDGIPVWLGARKMSAHQQSFSEILALASLKNALPEKIVLVGIQYMAIEFGSSLSDMISAKICEAATLCLSVLAQWGIAWRRKDDGKKSVLPLA